MVKHQRRSHQRGIHSSELDDCTSDSGSEESPSTPKSHAMHWPPQHMGMMGPNGHHLQRAASFADFGQQMGTYAIQQNPYSHRHSLSGGAHEYHGVPQMHPHEAAAQHPQQHPGVQMLQRTSSMPQHSYYVTEHNNPGVATMNTNPQANGQPPMHAQYQIPRQGVERLPLEIPYGQAQAMTGSVQSSPSSFSAVSGRSPSTQDGFYTHAPTQTATYALHTASPVEQQAPQMAAFQGAMVPQAQVMAQVPPPQPQQAPPAPQPTPEQYQQSQPQPEDGWYDGVQYQPPVEVATIGQIPAYGSGVYEPWGPKLDFDDGTMQLPSVRIANM